MSQFIDIIQKFFHIIVEYLYDPNYTVFMVNNPNKFAYKEFSKYELSKYLEYPVETDEIDKSYPHKMNIHHISICGSGRIGCKLKFLHIRKKMDFVDIINKFIFINKTWIRSNIEEFKLSIKKLRLEDNLKFKLEVKKVYDRHPNFYENYFNCEFNLPDTYFYRNKTCKCYDLLQCDLCLLAGKLISNRARHGNDYMCDNCKKEYWERRREKLEHKKDCRDDY